MDTKKPKPVIECKGYELMHNKTLTCKFLTLVEKIVGTFIDIYGPQDCAEFLQNVYIKQLNLRIEKKNYGVLR